MKKTKKAIKGKVCVHTLCVSVFFRITSCINEVFEVCDKLIFYVAFWVVILQ